MKVDYSGRPAFEERYKSRKAANEPGWTDDEGYAKLLAELEKASEAGYVPASGRVLELGCGAGNATLWFSERGFEAHGVDISPTAIDWAKERAAQQGLRAEFRVGDVVTLDGYPDDCFDYVLDGGCLHCIIGKDRPICLKSVCRVLKAGGLCRVATTCGSGTVKKPLDLEDGSRFDPQTCCLLRNGVPYYFIALPQDILEEIASAGLEVLRWEVAEYEGRPTPPFVGGTLFVHARKPASANGVSRTSERNLRHGQRVRLHAPDDARLSAPGAGPDDQRRHRARRRERAGGEGPGRHAGSVEPVAAVGSCAFGASYLRGALSWTWPWG